MPVVTSPSLLLFYPLDESMPKGTRRNYGELSTAQDLTPSQSSGTDGIPSVADGRGGRALDLFVVRTGYTTSARGCKGPASNPGSSHPALCALPIASAADDFAYGARFQWRALNTGGGAGEHEWIFGLRDTTSGQFGWGLQLLPDDPTTPTGAFLCLRLPGGATHYDIPGLDASYVITGSPANYYILPNEWYRAVVRIFFSATGWSHKLYVIRESTGTVYTFAWNNPAVNNNYSVAGSTDMRVWVGLHPGSNPIAFTGYVDECWLYDAALSDSEALGLLAGGLSIPFTPPSYRREASKLYSAVTREGGTFPKPRPLPTGAKITSHPVDILCHEARWHLEGWHAGRPWALNSVELIFDTAGPHGRGGGAVERVANVNAGLWRSPGPKPNGALEDARNVVHTEQGPRRRQGFKVRRSVSTESTTALNSLHTFRAYDGGLYWVYKVGTSLYYDTGDGVTSLDTGWSPAQAACAFFHDNRLVILSGARQRMWDGGVDGVDPISQAAPTSLSLAASAGGTLNGTYFYAYTEYDPVTGDESAPKVSAASVSPSTQKVRLTMDATLGGRWTHRRIYRTANGGSSPNLFFVAQITSATTYDDTGLADGTELVDQVNGTFITSVAPDTFSLGCVHAERAFYSGGATFPERIYVTEPNEVMRWYTSFFLVCEGPVRCVIGYGHRLVAFTDHTVEIFESDWIRDDAGNVSVQRTVVSRTVGAYGPNAALVQGGILWWADVAGIHRLEGSEPKLVSDRIQDLFPYVNRTLARHVVAGYNHIRRQLWWTFPHGSLQEDSTRFQTQFFMQADDPSRWGIADLDAPWVGVFDDDVNGLKFGAMDHLGVLKELEAYEGDGAQGNEAFTTEDEGTDGVTNVGIKSVSGATVTVYGSPGWTSDGLRGMSAVLRDRSTGRLYYYTIVSNTTGTDPSFTVERDVATALAARDGWFVGGIRAFADGAGQDQGSPNRKYLREIQYALSDLTASLYL